MSATDAQATAGNLEGRSVLVAGATGGLGSAIAVELARRGARLTLVARRSFDQALAREARRRRIRVIDARPPHTETGLATRPITGHSPKMPVGLDPAAVAKIIVNAIAGDLTDLPSAAFG